MTTTPEYCPVCDSPAELVSGDRAIKFGHRRVNVLDERMRCPECGEEFYLPEQLEATQQRAAEKIRREEGLLSPAEIKSIRQKFDFTQAQFERLLNVGQKTVVRWEAGAVCPNAATNELIWLLGENQACARLLWARRNAQARDSALAEGSMPAARVLPFERRERPRRPANFPRIDAPTKVLEEVDEEPITMVQAAAVG